MSDKLYPVDEQGQLDAARPVEGKPCARRLNWKNADGAIAVTWCTREHGHEGTCEGPTPRVVEVDDLGPAAAKRRRF